MKTRAITAFFFTIVMLGSFFFGAYTFSIFYLALSTMGLIEFYKLIKSQGTKPNRSVGVLLSLVIFLIFIGNNLFDWGSKYLLLLIPAVFLVFILELYKREKEPFANIGYTFLGIIYVTIPFCLFYTMGFMKHSYNFHLPFSFILMLWASDTGAYLFGRKLGKTRLFERHSPKKSWEGFFGGVFTSVLVSFIISMVFTEINAYILMGMAVLVVSFGTLGDLVESMLKRSLNVKDSGTLLPGHGGILDRFDGLLIGAPIVFTYLYLLLN